MRLLITGLNGTLAPKVATAAAHRGWQVSGWDRHRFPPDNISACHTFLAETKPDAIMHLAMGSEIWAELLAAYAAAHRLADRCRREWPGARQQHARASG